MMFFGRKAPASVSATPSQLLPRAEKVSRWLAGNAHQTQGRAVSEGRQTEAEGFSPHDCAIWNDIRRALDGGSK